MTTRNLLTEIRQTLTVIGFLLLLASGTVGAQTTSKAKHPLIVGKDCAQQRMTDRSRPGSKPGTVVVYADYGTSLAAMHDYFTFRTDFHVAGSSYRTDYTQADLIKERDLYPACARGNLYPTTSPTTGRTDTPSPLWSVSSTAEKTPPLGRNPISCNRSLSWSATQNSFKQHLSR